jgi:hypothetical protein
MEYKMSTRMREAVEAYVHIVCMPHALHIDYLTKNNGTLERISKAHPKNNMGGGPDRVSYLRWRFGEMQKDAMSAAFSEIYETMPGSTEKDAKSIFEGALAEVLSETGTKDRFDYNMWMGPDGLFKG